MLGAVNIIPDVCPYDVGFVTIGLTHVLFVIGVGVVVVVFHCTGIGCTFVFVSHWTGTGCTFVFVFVFVYVFVFVFHCTGTGCTFVFVFVVVDVDVPGIVIGVVLPPVVVVVVLPFIGTGGTTIGCTLVLVFVFVFVFVLIVVLVVVGNGFVFESITAGPTGVTGTTIVEFVVFCVGVTVPFYFQSTVLFCSGFAPLINPRNKKYNPVSNPANNNKPSNPKQHLFDFFFYSYPDP